MDCEMDEKQSFETALKNLEEVVGDLENGEIQLTELLEKYTQGVLLSKFCLEQLAATEKAMDKILHESNGEVKETILEIKGE